MPRSSDRSIRSTQEKGTYFMAGLDYDYIATLVRRTKQGDSDAFAELYTATYQQQYRFIYRYFNDVYQAQDILQEVYIIVLKNIKTLKNPRLFVSWLNQINFRVCFDISRKMKKHGEDLMPNDGFSSVLSEDMGPEDTVLKGLEQTELQSSILSLPPREAQAIIMKYYNNMTIDEISDAMNLSKSTVKRQLANGRKSLKKLLSYSGKEVTG